MKSTMAEMEAIAVSEPAMRHVMHPEKGELVPHLCYDAEVQYKTKDNVVRLIMCSKLDTIDVGNPVMITYHSGMRCYKHSRHVVTSNHRNCIGGFYYTDGTSAE
tara:strand:- start:562 stop:873 length:312 start_codon:yes stop_codon:yes gene_type:complete